MKRLLLDAQTLLWWDMGSPALGKNARRIIENADAVHVSAASEWELAIKAALGRLVLPRSILEAVMDAGFEPLAISFEHAQFVRNLRAIHKDPFDRLLVAVALVEGLALVTSDEVLAQYPVNVIDSRR